VVGTVSYQHLTLFNDSVCCLYYKLCVEQSVGGPYTDDGRVYVNSLGSYVYRLFFHLTEQRLFYVTANGGDLMYLRC